MQYGTGSPLEPQSVSLKASHFMKQPPSFLSHLFSFASSLPLPDVEQVASMKKNFFRAGTAVWENRRSHSGSRFFSLSCSLCLKFVQGRLMEYIIQ